MLVDKEGPVEVQLPEVVRDMRPQDRAVGTVARVQLQDREMPWVQKC